jgi:hypothetical protein
MTTTEKRGFRLPWGGDNRKPDDEPEEGPGAAAAAVLTPASDLAPALAPGSGTSVRSGSMLRRGQTDELGRGPFDLAPVEEADVSDAASSLVEVVEHTPKLAEPAAEPERDVIEGGSTAVPAWPEVDRRGSAAHLASDAPPPPVKPAVVVEGGPKKVNPLVAGLVKAMRDAARAARDETTARMRADAAARAEEIRLEAVAAGTALRKQADEDVAAIREWSRSEIARIKQETETRIADRKTRLVEETQAHAAATEQLNVELKDAIAAFESDMEQFFETLLHEEDPARLATLAERLPEPPTFARLHDISGPRKAPRAPRSTAPRKPAEHRERAATRLAPDAAAAAEAEAILGLDDEAASDEPVGEAVDDAVIDVVVDPDHDTNGHVAPVAEATDDADSISAWTEALAAIRAQAGDADDAAMPAEAAADPVDEPATDRVEEVTPDDPDLGAFEAPDSLLGVLAGASRINSPDDLSPEERIALLGFDEPAPGEEPAPMNAVPVEMPATESITRVVVGGLASVAEISGFKSALVGVPGVSSVSVTAGTDGDFVFSVVHATPTDLRTAVPGFARFNPQLTADEGAVLRFALAEPGS